MVVLEQPPMNVYLVPAARDRHELYCEVAPPPPDVARAGTPWGRLVAGFRRMVDEGEAERHGLPVEDAPARGPLRRAITRRVAEAVAEQRLLWHLRHESAVTLYFPDDLDAAHGLAVARGLISADDAKHLRWCVIDALIAAVTGPVLFLVPGPNVVSWYFAFRAVGHFFALRGARNGLRRAVWTSEPSHELAEIRSALALDPDARAHRVGELETVLGLERLHLFVDRIA
jgi:hypothetical protein